MVKLGSPTQRADIINAVLPLLLCSSGAAAAFSSFTSAPLVELVGEACSPCSAFSGSVGPSEEDKVFGGIVSAPGPASATASACEASDGNSLALAMAEGLPRYRAFRSDITDGKWSRYDEVSRGTCMHAEKIGRLHLEDDNSASELRATRKEAEFAC